MIIARIRMLFVVGLVGVLLSVFTSNAVFGATTCTFKINASRTKIGMSCRSSQANTIPFTQTLTKESSRLYSFTSNGCKMSVTTSSNTKGVHKTVDKLGLPSTVASCPGLPSSQGNITISQSSTENPAEESQTDQENIDKCEEKDEVYNPDSVNPDKCDPKCEASQTLQDGKCTGDTTTKCNVEGVGWIVCPVIGFLTKLNDTAYDFIKDLLTVPAAIFDNAGAKNAWEAFRNIANVAFVIAFMVIIYSQITGAGLSNYGIKKLLPKLIVTAILVNASFYICAIAVDISNIVGISIKSFLENIPVGSDLASSGQEGIWDEAGGLLLKGTIGIGILLLVFLAPASLLAFALVIFILIARQAFVILLIVVSPLAFVAYLLPNTEDWFTKWRKALTAMLLVFPIVGAVFGVSKLASDILLEVAQSSVDGEPTLKIIAASVLAVPLFAIPGLLKGAMAGAGTVGARLSGMADKAQGRAGAGLKSRYGESALAKYGQYRKSERTKRQALTQAGQYVGRNPLRRGYSAVASKVNRSPATGQFGDRLAAGGISVANKEEAETIGLQEALIANDLKSNPKAAQKALKEALVAGDTTKARAAQNHLLKSGVGREAFHEAMSTNAVSSDMSQALRGNIQANHSDIKTKDIALDAWAYGGPDESLAGLRAGTKADGSSIYTDAAGNGTFSDAELSGQSLASVAAIRDAGSLNPTQAKRVAADPRLSVNMKPEVLAELKRIGGP